MADTLHELGRILLNGVPTFLLFFLLYFYLKFMFFKPMEQKMKERYDVTAGARKMAEQALARATAKTAEYEGALRAARSEIYASQEKMYKELQDREAAELADARSSAEASVRQAREQLAQDVAEAKAALARESEAIASQIADSILRSAA